MPRGVPVHPETREKIVAALRAGTSRNQVARDLKVSTTTVTRIARSLKIEFDRSQTAIAVRARQVDLAEASQMLAQKMVLVASEMLDKLDDPYLVYSFGGKDNTYEEHTLDSAPVEVRRSTVVTAGIAFDKVRRIVERENSGLDETVGMLDTLADGFRQAAERLRPMELAADGQDE